MNYRKQWTAENVEQSARQSSWQLLLNSGDASDQQRNRFLQESEGRRRERRAASLPWKGKLGQRDRFRCERGRWLRGRKSSRSCRWQWTPLSSPSSLSPSLSGRSLAGRMDTIYRTPLNSITCPTTVEYTIQISEPVKRTVLWKSGHEVWAHSAGRAHQVGPPVHRRTFKPCVGIFVNQKFCAGLGFLNWLASKYPRQALAGWESLLCSSVRSLPRSSSTFLLCLLHELLFIILVLCILFVDRAVIACRTWRYYCSSSTELGIGFTYLNSFAVVVFPAAIWPTYAGNKNLWLPSLCISSLHVGYVPQSVWHVPACCLGWRIMCHRWGNIARCPGWPSRWLSV